MNSIFLSNLPTGATNVTGNSTLFKQATFISASGFTAAGILTQTWSGRFYLGAQTGQLPIFVSASGSPYQILTLNQGDKLENLSNYYVAPVIPGDGVYVLYA